MVTGCKCSVHAAWEVFCACSMGSVLCTQHGKVLARSMGSVLVAEV